ncbi:nuclear transport factor 2 family protein [Roseomonas sp. BN140053]|uniref:nuclear transport factor 2 family protein n=1 Tax=Roseomonas sp. BN140053 TaxID=3391898 RepID=UPI0039E9F5DD
MATADMRRAAEHDAQKVINRFFHCLDDGRYEELSDLMAPEGIWHRQGKELKGPGMVLEAMRARPASLATRHVVTNLVVDARADDLVEAAFYVTVYGHSGGTIPAPLELPLHVSLYRETLTGSADGWHIAEITSSPTFKR